MSGYLAPGSPHDLQQVVRLLYVNTKNDGNMREVFQRIILKVQTPGSQLPTKHKQASRGCRPT